MLDLLIRNGTVIDGTGAERLPADVGVAGGRIVQIGRGLQAAARQTIDAAGCLVTPGFIDVHTHSDGPLLRQRNFAAKTTQGFTTEVLMLDGIAYAPVTRENWREWFYYLRALDGLRLDEYQGWLSIDDYMQCLDGTTAQNSLPLVAYANVRAVARGFGPGPVDDFQALVVAEEIARGMQAGAAGLSTGLDYIVQCHATTDELVEACRAIAPFQGVYVTHVRYKQGLRRALEEAVEIGRRAEVAVHISHLKAVGGMSLDDVLEFLDRARRDVDLSFDVYPYQSGSTMLNYLLPYETWEAGPLAATTRLADPRVRQRFAVGLKKYRLDLDRIRIAWVAGAERKDLEGQTLGQFVAASGKEASDALCDLLIEERLAVLLVLVEGDDQAVFPLLEHDLFMMGSDGIYLPGGAVHPRVYGSASRLLHRAARSRGGQSLEHAVRKMTQYPAERFGLRERGVIREGYWADLVVVDPAAVEDRATYEQPHQVSLGIPTVVVNGVPIVENGVPRDFENEAPPGRRLRFRA